MSRPPMNSVAQCAKCGHGAQPGQDPNGVAKRSCRYDRELQLKVDGTEFYRDEWLERTCARCGYTWEEACVDA